MHSCIPAYLMQAAPSDHAVGQFCRSTAKMFGHSQAAGMVLKKEDYTVRVPRSQRGGEIVEPLVREQWFVRMQPLAQPALKVEPVSPLPPSPPTCMTQPPRLSVALLASDVSRSLL